MDSCAKTSNDGIRAHNSRMAWRMHRAGGRVRRLEHAMGWRSVRSELLLCCSSRPAWSIDTEI